MDKNQLSVKKIEEAEVVNVTRERFGVSRQTHGPTMRTAARNTQAPHDAFLRIVKFNRLACVCFHLAAIFFYVHLKKIRPETALRLALALASPGILWVLWVLQGGTARRYINRITWVYRHDVRG